MESVTILGGSGLVGSHLVNTLKSKFKVNIASTQKDLCENNPNYLYWNYKKGELDPAILQTDHLINLAGAGIADKPWTKTRKQDILDSRVKSTEFVLTHFKKHNIGLKSYVGASAMGYYGHCPDVKKSESDPPCSKDFLSEVCDKWEKSHAEAEDIANSYTLLRIGTVFSRDGGALKPMIAPLKFGLAVYMGDGKQYVSWIHIADLCKLIEYSMTHEKGLGILNAASPNPVTNKGLMALLKKHINPFSLLLPAPKIFLKLFLGELSMIVLNNCLLSTEKLTSRGFVFEYPSLENALVQLFPRK